MYGLPGPTRVKRLKGVATADDLVHRKFHRLSPNELWVTDITEHPTREGKVFCAAVLDACSRKIVGWAIDSKQDSTLVVNALDMALRARAPSPGGIDAACAALSNCHPKASSELGGNSPNGALRMTPPQPFESLSAWPPYCEIFRSPHRASINADMQVLPGARLT